VVLTITYHHEKEDRMAKLTLGILCGLVFGGLAVATMIPLSFNGKRAAMLGAFLNRFAIGVVIGAAQWRPWQ
jgi:hypothetical protein